MAVYYKLKSEKEYSTLPIECSFVSVGDFKFRIFHSKRYGKGKDFDLIVTNAQTNEEYVDENALIPKNTSVLIRRIPHPLLKPIIPEEPKNVAEATQLSDTDSLVEKHPAEPDWDFGEDIYSNPKKVSHQTNNALLNKLDEDRKIEALVNTPALHYQSQTKDANVSSVRALSGRISFSSCNGIFGFKKPPPGYICHRCKVQGHLIQQCPTKGDHNFDVKKLKRASGIPKSMLLVTPDGSYSLPNGDTAILQPNEDAFAKEIDGIPSVHYASDLPPELNCPLCQQIMKDAVMSSKCCFASFCDKCIRDHIMSKSMCNCGAKNILADDLIPNLTLRGTINSIMFQNSSSKNSRSSVTYEGSKHHVEPVPPPASACSIASTIENDSLTTEEPSKVKGGYGRNELVNNYASKSAEKTKKENADELKALPEETIMKKSAPKRHASFNQEHLGKMADGAEGKKKKKLKCTDSYDAQPPNMAFQNLSAMYDGGGSPFIPTPYYAYFGFAGYEATSAAGTPYLSYASSAYDAAVGGIMQDPYGRQVYPFNTQELQGLESLW